MDNRIFNVNGRTKEQLDLAVKTFMLDDNDDNKKVAGWYISKEKGLVLTWYVTGNINPFTDKFGRSIKIIDPIELSNVLWEWLKSNEAKTIECEGWDKYAEIDGNNDKGWRLYTENWGCITETNKSMDNYSLGAFKPAWLWYGK